MEISKPNRRIDLLYPTLQAFDWPVQIFFMKFMDTLAETFYDVGESEATKLLTLTYYL